MGVQGFIYDIRTAILPLFFLFNHDILLKDIDSVWLGCFIFAMTSLGMVAFTSAIQGWLYNKTNILERLLLVIATVVLLYPHLLTGYFLP